MSDPTLNSATMQFGSLVITYDDRLLTPRPWTAAQSRWAAAALADHSDPRLLELCTGAGHIGLLAVAEVPAPAVLVDVDPHACRFARDNARQVSSPVDVRCGSMDEVLAENERFSVVIADPPWVPSAQTGRFPQDPLTAIDGGSDGLDLARRCAGVIDAHLTADGLGIVQLGTGEQAEIFSEWLAASGLALAVTEVRSHAPRGVLVSVARLPSERP